LALDASRQAILKKLRAIPPEGRTADEQRWLDDLEHQQGICGIQDAIQAGTGEPQQAPEGPKVPTCPKCKSTAVQGTTCPRKIIWRCLEEGCGNKWEAAVGATLQGTFQVRPDPPPSVPVGPDDFMPSGAPAFRHPFKNYEE